MSVPAALAAPPDSSTVILISSELTVLFRLFAILELEDSSALALPMPEYEAPAAC